MARPRIVGTALVLCVIALVRSAAAHSAPFTYLDIEVAAQSLELTLVAHTFDVAHDLNVDPPERLLDPAVLKGHGEAFARLLNERLRLTADDRPLVLGAWSAAEALPERQSIQLRAHVDLATTPGIIRVTARLFPYDPVHQTFINFHEGEAITAQTILDVGRADFAYYAGTSKGIWSLVRALAATGLAHVISGPEHLMMLVGLLLMGSTRRRMVVIASAFTLGHILSVGLAMLNVVSPPARLVEPAIALSIVYVGVDNLMVHGGRDIRAWISLAFGVIHGFGFVTTLRAMELPRPALAWSILSLNIGIEAGQILAAFTIAAAVAALRGRSEAAARQLAFVGSVVVIAAGTAWFVQRVFFPGGMA